MTKSIFTNNYAKFLEILVRHRKASHITQTELAQKLHQSQSYVSKYENAERRLDVVEFVQIAKALKADPVSIIDELVGNWKNQ